jgi:uncharacterized membrane protein
MTTKYFRDALLHWAFRLGILLKGLDGVVEIIGGSLFLCFSRGQLADFIGRVTRGELLEDPDDLIANSLRHAFDHLSTSSKVFVAVYLLGHGVVKLLLVVGLWRRKQWVYPFACVMLIGFIGYQTWRMFRHFSAGLCIFTFLDGIILALIWNEYRINFRTKNPGANDPIQAKQPAAGK